MLYPKKLSAFELKFHSKPYDKLRNYHEIHFTGNSFKDITKLDYARIRIGEIIQQQDSINGIRFSFGESTKADIFIHVLDVLNQERALIYFVDKGDIWFYEEPFIRELPVCGNTSL